MGRFPMKVLLTGVLSAGLASRSIAADRGPNRDRRPEPPIIPAFGGGDGIGSVDRRVEKAATYLAAIVQACQEDIQESLELAAPQTPSDADEDVPSDTQLSSLGNKLKQKAEAMAALAETAGIKGWQQDPEKLGKIREQYRRTLRERDLRRAEGNLEQALRRRRIDQVSIDPAARKLISSLKSFLSDFKRARAPAAELASQDPSRKWKEKLSNIEHDIADLQRETRILDIQLSLQKLQEINMDSNLR